jgi:hypothetical protein
MAGDNHHKLIIHRVRNSGNKSIFGLALSAMNVSIPKPIRLLVEFTRFDTVKDDDHSFL